MTAYVATARNPACAAVDTAIVGGGIVGTSCAYFLAERGAAPLLIESGNVGREASGVNAGGVRQQGRPAVEMPMALASISLWADLAQRLGVDLEYDRCGDVRLAETQDDAERLRRYIGEHRTIGLPLEWVEGVRLSELIPGVAPTAVAGALSPTGGQANPFAVSPGFARQARRLGAMVWENTPVQMIHRDGSGYTLVTSRGPVRAERVVIAAGAWSGELTREMGITLPVRMLAPQMLVTVPIPRVVRTVILGYGRRLSLKQMRSGAVVIGGGLRARGDLQTRGKFPSLANFRSAVEDATAVVPPLRGAYVLRSWVGLEGYTPDDLPIVDRLHGQEVYVATGFSGHGFAVGPVVGRFLAEWLLDGRPSLDLSPFRLSRFSENGSISRSSEGHR